MYTVLLPPGVNPTAVNKYSNILTYTSKFKPNYRSTSFHTELEQLPKKAPIRRSMKLISTRKPKSKHRKTCPEIIGRGFSGYII
jgi:hypothetical protein